jgi:antitoxin CptB
MSSRGQLRWRCRRGMKELDELLLAYLERHYEAASGAERQAFAELLELPDPQLWRYLGGLEKSADGPLAAVIDQIAARR